MIEAVIDVAIYVALIVCPAAPLHESGLPPTENSMNVSIRTLTLMIVIVGCFSISTMSASPRSTPERIAGRGPVAERAAVVEVLRDYLRVTDARDRAAIGRSFHPSAVLNSVTASGSLKTMTQDEWWQRVSRIPADTPPRKSEIALVEVVGSAAVARIDIVNANGSASTDMFTLMKTGQGWRIVNKVLSSPL